MGAKYTEAQKRATEKYKAVSRDKLTLDIPKGSVTATNPTRNSAGKA